jgi:hypothetical protein
MSHRLLLRSTLLSSPASLQLNKLSVPAAASAGDDAFFTARARVSKLVLDQELDERVKAADERFKAARERVKAFEAQRVKEFSRCFMRVKEVEAEARRFNELRQRAKDSRRSARRYSMRSNSCIGCSSAPVLP